MADVKTGQLYRIPMGCQPPTFIGVNPLEKVGDCYYCFPVYIEPTGEATRKTDLGYTLHHKRKKWIVSEAWLMKFDPELSAAKKKSKKKKTKIPSIKGPPKKRFLFQLDQYIQRRKPLPDKVYSCRSTQATTRPRQYHSGNYEKEDLLDHAFHGGLCSPK